MSSAYERQVQLDRTIDVIKTYGLTPVRIRAGQKAPTSDWDPRKTANVETVINSISSDNIAVHMYNRLVDVDVDTFDPMVVHALDICLPASSLVWGRPSKPRSHRLYMLEHEFNRDAYAAVLRTIKGLEVNGTSLSVEVRGGQRASGFV
ncbi:hypothetical protein EBT25_14235, partial [bacterium]|nr:hypothetical protein [bacterium]